MRKSLNVNEETLRRFRSFGIYGESYEDLLNRLMDIAEKAGTKSQKKLLEVRV